MLMTLSEAELTAYVARQVSSFYPDKEVAPAALSGFVREALERADFCFSRINLKYYFDGAQTRFNHLHTDQYAMFLYFLANTIYRREGDLSLAEKLYGLNKALHGIDVFYEVELPDIFAFQHPVGTVLGRAKYSNYLYVYQRCSTGANLKAEYPTLGEGVVMFGGTSIIGNSVVGDNCWFSLGTVIMDLAVPSNSVVFGHSPNTTIKPTTRSVIENIFSVNSLFSKKTHQA